MNRERPTVTDAGIPGTHDPRHRDSHPDWVGINPYTGKPWPAIPSPDHVTPNAPTIPDPYAVQPEDRS